MLYYKYKLTDKLSEKRRLYKAHGSSNNIVLNDDNTSAKEKLNNEVVIDKLSFSKLEEENKSLKKKIDEMNNSIKNKDKSKEESDNDLKNKNSILLQEKKDLNLIISVIFKLIQNLRKEEFSSIEKTETIAKEVEKLNKDLIKKDEQIKKYAEENENVRRYNEVLRNELTQLKGDLEKKENQLSITFQKLTDIEREKLVS